MVMVSESVERDDGCCLNARPAEEVAQAAVDAAKAWLQADVPVDEYLADQLLLPMALAGSGSFRTTKPALPPTTNAGIIQHFVPVLWKVASS